MELPLTSQSSYLLGFLAFLVFLCRSWLPRPGAAGRKRELQLPPEPAGAWPVVGHLPLFGGKEIAARTLARMADDYGPILMLRLGVHRTLVISSQEAAKECFTRCDADLASRPNSAAAKYLAYDRTMIGLAPYGPHWREVRKVTTDLLSSPRLEKLRQVRTAEVDARITELYQLCGKDTPPKVEMKKWFGETTFNVIVRMIVGRRYFGGATDDGEILRFQKALEEVLYLAGVFVPSDAVPCLEWLDLKGYISAMKKAAKEMEDVMVTWIEERRRKRRSEGGKIDGDRDFIDVVLTATEGDDLSGLDPVTAMKGTLLNIILGSTQPSSVTMTWAVALLMNHRRVLHKLREELDMHVGKARNVEEADVGTLVYLQAVLKETLRLYAPAALSAPHEATRDCRIGGYHVPAGTRLLTNLWKLHRDPRVWSEPLEFRPERFLEGDAAAVDGRGRHFEYLPFGSGRRMCPGVTLGLQVMHLALARLVHGFELETPGGAPVDMGEGQGMHVTKAAPLEVLVTPRLPPHLHCK